jgi:hypothetical protein
MRESITQAGRRAGSGMMDGRQRACRERFDPDAEGVVMES